MDEFADKSLQERIGRSHLQRRLDLEGPPSPASLNPGIVHRMLRTVLKLSGLSRRGGRNARDIQLVVNQCPLPGLPDVFDGLTLLHLSDLHLAEGSASVEELIILVAGLDYDICVLTGDYLASPSCCADPSLPLLERLARRLKGPVYAVLGNHDSIRMVAAMEAMGIRVLLNESVLLQRDGRFLHIAGVDDAHYFGVDNLDKAAGELTGRSFAILLSHTPEIFHEAAAAGFRLMLCGHTHGGQVCLPGGIPVVLEADCPRKFGRGVWCYKGMQGYTSRGVGTSILPVRFNCRPEVTLHRLRAVSGRGVVL